MSSFDLSEYVKSNIIDIRDDSINLDMGKLLVDTNVLYFYYYDRWSLLGALNLGPYDNQLQDYSRFFGQLLSNDVELFLHRSCISEFLHIIYLAEVRILYCDKNNLTSFDPSNFKVKQVIRAYYDEERAIRRRLVTYLSSIKKSFKLLNVDSTIDEFLTDCVFEWQNSLADVTDSLIVTEAKKVGIDSVLTDDSDFVSFEGLNIYTANTKAITAFESKN